MAGGDGGGVADRGSWATSSSSLLPPLSTQKATPSATPLPAAPGVGGQGGGHLLPPSALTEGEYLLHLIQKGSRSQPGPPPPPPSSAAPGVGGGGGNHDDPAVAALGPSIPLPRQPSAGGFPADAGASLNPHPHGPPWAGYPGFHQAPWAASSLEFGPRRPPPPGFPHQPQNFYHQYNPSLSGVIPAFSPPQLGFLPGHFNAKDLQGNPGHSQHLQQPWRDAFSTEGVPPVFGSLIQFPPDKIDGSSRGVEIRRDVVNSRSMSQKISVDYDQERERLLANRRSLVDKSFPESNWTHQPKGHQRPSHPRRDNGERVGQKQQGSPHLGSGKVEQGRALYLRRKAKDVVNPVLSSNARNREHTVEKQVAPEKGEAKEFLHNEESILSRHPELGTQFDQSTPSLGNHAHSSLASDGKEHREDLHFGRVSTVQRGEQIIDAGVGSCICVNDFNEAQEFSSEQVRDSLMLTDEIAEKRVEPHAHASRGKDYRSDSRGCRVLSQGMRNRQRVLRCRRDIAKFTPSFLAIYESLIPTEEEKAKQKQLLQSLEKLVVNEWPNAKLHLYGSCANSFGVSNCDIDICLEIDDNDINKSEIILKLADILQSNNLQNVQALTRARVPIVKLMDPVTGISCDICINNILAVVNTKLLRDYAQIDDRLRQLAFIVKHWAKSRGVNDTYQGTLSSYAYVLMCIHFLQLRKPAVLPCLQEMVATYDETVDGIKCSFFDQVEKLHDFGAENRESIAELLWAFFSYWAYHHDYKNDVISVRTGGFISKESKDWTRRIGNDRHLICIEDPFELSHDLGRVVDKYTVKIVREEFERAAEIMQNDQNPSVRLFEPYVRVSEED